MTNVKLKLMFFLLNALLTADIVHARPYSDNNATDIVFKFNNNDTYLPVEANTDTLIVNLNEEDTKPHGTDNDAAHMDEMMEAEQDRDEDLSKKIIKDQQKPSEETEQKPNLNLDAIIKAEQSRDISISRKVNQEPSTYNLSPKDKDSFEKQKNNSSPFLEELIDSETDREETLTDILFRPRSEAYAESPRFEFLIAGKINESELTNKSVNGKSDNNLDKVDRNSSDVLKKADYVELVEIIRVRGNKFNITANEVDNDIAPDTNFTDVQTLILAAVVTLMFLLVIMGITTCIRCCFRCWCPTVCPRFTAMHRVQESESSESDKQDDEQLKSESADSVESSGGHAANGSIFTMTLKNNHLIVETEERNDITKNGRETKMKYSPDNDGSIFVVEVQQSASYRPNNTKSLTSPPHDPQISTNQALIHRVPEELEKKLEDDSERSSARFDKNKALALSSTGLSISDLSMSSIGSHNVSYSYGSQMGYEHGPFGYPIYAGYDTKEDTDGIIHDNSQEPLICKTPNDPDKPVVTAAIFKQDSLISNDVLQGPSYCIEGSSDGPLLSDVQAREVSLQHIQDKKMEKLNGVAVTIPEKIASPKKQPLNRADSLPVRLAEEIPESIVEKTAVMEVINENNVADDEITKDLLKGKRASLPIINTESETAKDVKRPIGSPKYEKYLSECFTEEELMYGQPPMITITEEEPAKSDS